MKTMKSRTICCMGVEERSHILKNTLTIHVVRDTKRIDEGGQLIPEGDEFC